MWATVVGSRRVGVASDESDAVGRRGPHVFLDTARPLRARGATGADDAKLSSSLSDPTKPSDSSSSSVSQASLAFFLGAGLALGLAAALAFAGAFAGAGLVATGLGGAGFGFGAAAFFGAGFFFCLEPQSSSESSS